MKSCLIFLSVFLAVSVCEGQKKTDTQSFPVRIEKIINSQWTFNYFPAESADKGYETVVFDDSRWPPVSIPHTWSTFETTGELHPFIRNASETDNPYWWNGWGWYRKHFTISTDQANRRVFVEFEGVQKYCKVWINGVYLGDHKGGYGSFDFDLTPHIKKGSDNVLAIAVNNRRNDQFRIPPMTAGNFNVYGGIYRDVKIVLKNNLYIPMQGSATHEGGTFITTPGLTAGSGSVRIQTWIKNEDQQPAKCVLTTTIYDAESKIVQSLKSTAEIKPGELYRFDQAAKPVKDPHLWSPENPYIYSIVSQVSDGKTTTDELTSTFGFRWFRWDYNENMLYVNGRKTLLHGGNRHQEYPWLGDAIPKWITEMDFTDMAENMNYNFMRTAHYPNDKYVYDLTDRLGIIINEEVPNIKNLDFSPEVQEQHLREMIRRDRNHPSIMIWSMGNETNKAVDSKLAIIEDTTRILTARRVNNGSQGKYAIHNDDNLPIENLLRCTVRGWYNTDVKNLEPKDEQHSGTEEHQMNMLKTSGMFGTGNLCTWLYEDHGADREYLNAPMLHVNPKGYVDVYRVPKYAYYFWQATYASKPMAFILPHYWQLEYLGQKKDIVVTSNCDRVELKVNGASKGIQMPDQSNFHTVTFRDVIIEKGIITATGTKDGQTAAWQISMAGMPARIVASSGHKEMTADQGSVAIIKADIADSDGNHVYGANNTLRWTITGPATLVGPAVYESDIERHHEMEGAWYMDVPVANVVRSTGEPGTIRVTVSAGGLISGSVEIIAKKVDSDNSIILEPVLSNEGRRGVERLAAVTRSYEEITGELKPAFGEISIKATGMEEYRKAISDYILKENPSIDTATTEFRALTRLFAVYLMNNGGRLIADDYSFNAEHFNKCRLIAGYVNATKLPQQYKDGLREHYSQSMIILGNEKNATEEMNWLNWMPSGGTVVYYDDAPGRSYPNGTLVSSKGSLVDLIAVVHPSFAGFSSEAKERAIEFIDKMNPHVISETVTEVIDGKKVEKTTIRVDKGKPVLIPLIKFISE